MPVVTSAASRGKLEVDVDVRAVVLDLDGTCLERGLLIHPRTEATIREVVRHLPVVLATGRMYRSALPWATRLGVTMPLVCYQGALVREIDSGATLQHVPLDHDTAQLAIEIARRHGWHRQAYVDDELLCEQDREEVQLYSKISNLPYRVVEDLVAAIPESSTKIVCGSVNEAAMQDCVETMVRELYGQAWVTMPIAPFCEIVNPNVSKSQAVDLVLARYGLSLADAVAFGDGPNDIDLLEKAAIGVAVETGDFKLLACADMTCGGPDDGGVGETIDRLGLIAAAVA